MRAAEIGEVDDLSHRGEEADLVGLPEVPVGGVYLLHAAVHRNGTAVEDAFDYPDAGLAERLVSKLRSVNLAPLPFRGRCVEGAVAGLQRLLQGVPEDVVPGLTRIGGADIIPPTALRPRKQRFHRALHAGALG